MTNLNFATVLTFCVYLLLICVIGWYAYGRTRVAADFFLGGRNLPAWVAALSAGASDTSGWLLIGLPGFAYVAGLEAVWIALGLVTGLALCWLSVAKRLRIYSEMLDDALTIPGFLSRRFASDGPWLRNVAAGFILLFFLFYVSSGLIAGAKLFTTVFAVPYHWAVLCGAVVIIGYTLVGGFLAVSWTDVLQGLMITLALVVVPLVVLYQLDGPGAAANAISSRNSNLLSLWSDNQGVPLGAIAIIGSLGWGLGYFGQPHILARFKAVHSPAATRQAAAIAIIWSLFVYSSAVAVGVLGVAYIAEPLPDGEQVFMVLVQTLLNPWVAGVLLAAILAAIMSTVDSQLLVCSAALAEDIYRGTSKRTVAPERAVVLGRMAVGAIAVVATALAMDPEAKVLDVVAYAWAGLGASLGPALLLSLYWRRMTAAGALAGVITGGLVVVVWKQLSGGLFDLYELVPGFVLSLVVIVLVSRATAAPGPAVIQSFERMLDIYRR